jgi:hypothetical protein
MKRTLLLTLSVALLALTAQAQPTPNAWINEIHYDDTGGGSDFIEVIVEDAGTVDLSLLDIELYRDAGTRYGPIGDLDTDFVAESTVGDFTIYTWENELQNGPSDGLALCYDDMPLQVLSYEGTFDGTEDCATDETSAEIGVSEDGANANTTSLQLEGTGTVYSNFTWTGPITNTKGAPNTGQSLSSDPGDPGCNSIAELKNFFGTDDVVKYNWDEGAGMFVLDEELTEDVDIIEIVDIQYKLGSDGEPDPSEPIAVTWSLKEGATAYAVSGIAVKQGQPCPSESDLVDYGGDPVTAGGTIKVEGTAISYIAFGIVPLENECKSTIVADLDNSTGEVVFKNDYGITELYFHLPDTDGLPDSGQPAVEGLLIDNVTGLDDISGTDDFDYYYASSGTDPGEVVVTFKDDPNTEDQQRFFLIAYSANSAGNATTRQQEENPKNTDPVCRTVIDPPFPMEQATTRFAVGGSYPNPFTASTTIRFDLPEPAEVNLAVYNVMGQKVAQLVDERLQKGPHAVAWDGRSNGGARLSSGLYFYRLTAGDRTEVHRLTLVR